MPGIDYKAVGVFLYGSKLIALDAGDFILNTHSATAAENTLGETFAIGRIAAHEFGHFLTMSTRGWGKNPRYPQSGHDAGPHPVGTERLMKLGTGKPDDPGDGRWTRHEDWKAANERAKDIVP